MEKRTNDQGNPNEGSMLQQKTNEDFNKKKPNPNDPNEKEGTKKNEVPDIGDDDLDPIEGEEIDPENEKPGVEEGNDTSTDGQTSEDKTDVREPDIFKYTGSE